MIPARTPSEFAERAYLEANPDVAAAVSDGVFRSGWEHFMLYGHREGRPGAPVSLDPWVEAVLKDPRQSPVPPRALRERVHGAGDESSFVRLGKTIAFDLQAVSGVQGLSSDSRLRVLDFGCGCGRVLPWLGYIYPRGEFHGTDIDGEAIEWCRDNLGGLAAFGVNTPDPPLPFDDGHFDFVYSISIFTHLPEAMQHAWLAELSRVTKPGGLLILTVRNARYLPGRFRRIRKLFNRKGFFHVKGEGTQGLPAFYQSSYHSEAYIRREWGRYFSVKDIQDLGVAGRQDLVICRK